MIEAKAPRQSEIATMIRREMGLSIGLVQSASLGRLMVDDLGILCRKGGGDQTLIGKNHYYLYYQSVTRWEVAAKGDTVDEWLYAEWADTQAQKLDHGVVKTGDRLAVALGTVAKQASGPVISIRRIALGLIEGDKHIHFVGAANLSGERGAYTKAGNLSEVEFYSAAMKFANDDRPGLTVSLNPLPRRSA